MSDLSRSQLARIFKPLTSSSDSGNTFSGTDSFVVSQHPRGIAARFNPAFPDILSGNTYFCRGIPVPDSTCRPVDAPALREPCPSNSV